MAAEQEAPTDRLSGMAYCLLPPETVHIDQNHQMFHSDEPEFNSTGGKAVQHGRIQDVDRVDHVIFHERYGWIKIPQTPRSQFNYLAYATAGYIPPFAVNVRKRKHWVERLAPEQAARMQDREVRIGSEVLMGNFYAEYALEQEVGSTKELDEFLNTGSNFRKRKIAHWLLTEALTQATDPLRDDFRKARKVGHMSLRNFDRLPFLMMSTIGPRNKENYMKDLWSKLAHATIIDEQALQTEVDDVQLAA